MGGNGALTAGGAEIAAAGVPPVRAVEDWLFAGCLNINDMAAGVTLTDQSSTPELPSL